MNGYNKETVLKTVAELFDLVKDQNNQIELLKTHAISDAAEIDRLKTQLAVYREDMAKDAEKIAELEKDKFLVSEKVRKVEWLLSNNSFDRTIKNCLKILRGTP